MSRPVIDFDGDGRELVRNAFDVAAERQEVRDNQCERDYQNFHAYIDMTGRDSSRANTAIPKIYQIIMTKVPKDIRAILGRRPYLPFEAKREEFMDASRIQSEILDTLLYRAGFFEKFVLAAYLKTLYGTSYMEAIPYFETIIEKQMQQITIPSLDGPVVIGQEMVPMPVKRLGFQLRVYAPWEVKVDPMATDLSTVEGCRFVVKIQLVSRRQLIKDAKAGKYGTHFDAGKLDDGQPEFHAADKHRGLAILSAMGIPEPREDSDIGVMLRYESPDRCVDLWNDREVVRDIDNPYRVDPDTGESTSHGLINLSRMIHVVDPHTQNQFFGNGEAKVNEILQHTLNDILNLALDNHQYLNQGKTFYDINTGVNPNQLVNAIGNKIGLHLQPGQKIQDAVLEDRGETLPRDHYALREVIENAMDLTSGSWEVGRGEPVSGRHTLGEISMLREAGDSRQELLVKSIENTFLQDLGHKCLAHIDWLGSPRDAIDIVGPEQAQQLTSFNPNDLPGGWDFVFKGSDRVLNQLIRQRNFTEFMDRIKENPYIKPREMAAVGMELYELSDKIDRLLYTEEEVAQMQQQQMEQQLAMADREQQAEFTSKVQLESAKSQIKVRDQAEVSTESGKKQGASASA